jgi:hypothetical protein
LDDEQQFFGGLAMVSFSRLQTILTMSMFFDAREIHEIMHLIGNTKPESVFAACELLGIPLIDHDKAELTDIISEG